MIFYIWIGFRHVLRRNEELRLFLLLVGCDDSSVGGDLLPTGRHQPMGEEKKRTVDLIKSKSQRLKCNCWACLIYIPIPY